jgi:PAS domain S-box-containing protein
MEPIVTMSTSDTSGWRVDRSKKYLRPWQAPAAAILVAAAALIFDASTPRVVSVTAPYVGLVLIGYWVPQPKAALALALLATPLIVLGYWISIPDSAPEWETWMNRGLSVGSVWLTAAFVWRIRILEEKLQRQIDVVSSLSREITWIASIVESGDDAIVSKNLDGIITSWNKGAERIFGYLAEEIIGKPITTLIPPERHHEEDLILGRIRRGDRVDHYDTIRRRKDGSLIDVSLTVSPVRGANGQVVGASKVARDVTERKRSEAQISVLAREAEHRAKNLLANVKAVVHLSRAGTPDGLKEVIEGRIEALANVQSLFVQSRWRGAELGNLVKQELSPYSHDGEQRTRIAGPAVMLQPDVAQGVAVALHELATNAAKYGALSRAKGEVEVTWSCASDDRVMLRWTEAGGPPVNQPTHRGFGTDVIRAMIQAHAGGDMRLDWRTEGLVCEIALPGVACQEEHARMYRESDAPLR